MSSCLFTSGNVSCFNVFSGLLPNSAGVAPVAVDPVGPVAVCDAFGGLMSSAAIASGLENTSKEFWKVLRCFRAVLPCRFAPRLFVVAAVVDEMVVLAPTAPGLSSADDAASTAAVSVRSISALPVHDDVCLTPLVVAAVWAHDSYLTSADPTDPQSD